MDARDLLSHLARDETFSEPGIEKAPGIDLLTLSFVAEVDAILLEDDPVAICVLLSDARCAVRRSGDGEPLIRLGILDGVPLLDVGERHLLCCMFRTHFPPGWLGRSSALTVVLAITLRILLLTAPGQSRTHRHRLRFLRVCDLCGRLGTSRATMLIDDRA